MRNEKSSQTGSIVKKGDIICTYTERVRKARNKTGYAFAELFAEYETVEKTVKAPCDGVVYFIEDQRFDEMDVLEEIYIAIYVTSYFDDYSELSNWHKATGGVSASGNKQEEQQ